MRKTRNTKTRLAWNLARNLFLWVGLITVVMVSALLIWIAVSILFLPSIDVTGQRITGGGTQIYDQSGKILLYEIGARRIWAAYNEIPQEMILAFLAAEDDQFFYHPGISLKGSLRSLWLNFKTLSFQYGGSTITQQLARNLFLNQKKTLTRKLREIILALELEKKYSKEEILTLYLNTINFGEGNYGVKAAADFYFNKDLKKLSWAEIATLAAIPRSPSYYTPTKPENLVRLRQRRDLILRRLFELGWIKAEAYKQAVAVPIKTMGRRYLGITAPHFVLEVKTIVEKMFPQLDLEQAGLKIITSLNYDYQKLAEQAVRAGVQQNTKLYGGKNASLLMLDTKTGGVLAMVGSADFNNQDIDGQVNMAVWPRQPGSAIKPFSYLTLFQLGYPIETIVFDLPTNFGTLTQPYRPNNFDRRYRGPVNLRLALAESRNIPAIKVFYLAEPYRVINNLKQFGITTIKHPIDYYGLSFGLGTAEMRMIDLARAYSIFANDGELVSQTLILSISDATGKTLYVYKPERYRVVDSQPVRMVNSILRDYQARAGLFQHSLQLTRIEPYDIALKTGTSDNYRDAWVFGYTPDVLVAVWAGNTDGKPMKPGGASLVAAVPIWHDFLSKVITDFPLTTLPQPLPVNVTKPMLNGKWLTPQGVHSILYYVDRQNPLGNQPTNPYTDPQFANWERAVNTWWLNDFSENEPNDQENNVSE